MKLSIFLGGIRPQNWLELYNSIPNATSLPKEEYELVIVSPYDLPPELQGVSNVRLIKDKGNPTRCYQLGALHSQGEYVVWIADDGTLSPTMSIDKGFAAIPDHHKGIVTFKYHEGVATKASQATQADAYWLLGSHKLHRRLLYVPDNYLLLMVALMKRDYLMEIGGWDCRIEQPGLSCPDLSVRLQNDGAEVIIGDKLLDISHLIGNAGDHGPIVKAFKHDRTLYNQIYSHPSAAIRSRIDFDNWKTVPEVWPRRFA